MEEYQIKDFLTWLFNETDDIVVKNDKYSIQDIADKYIKYEYDNISKEVDEYFPDDELEQKIKDASIHIDYDKVKENMSKSLNRHRQLDKKHELKKFRMLLKKAHPLDISREVAKFLRDDMFYREGDEQNYVLLQRLLDIYDRLLVLYMDANKK